MAEFFSRFDGGEIIAMLAVAGVFLCGAIGIITDHLHKMRVTTLKEEMINRGMSAGEIQTVLNAGRRSCRRRAEREESLNAGA
jgi:hypothetical protein